METEPVLTRAAPNKHPKINIGTISRNPYCPWIPAHTTDVVSTAPTGFKKLRLSPFNKKPRKKHSSNNGAKMTIANQRIKGYFADLYIKSWNSGIIGRPNKTKDISVTISSAISSPPQRSTWFELNLTKPKYSLIEAPFLSFMIATRRVPQTREEIIAHMEITNPLNWSSSIDLVASAYDGALPVMPTYTPVKAESRINQTPSNKKPKKRVPQSPQRGVETVPELIFSSILFIQQRVNAKLILAGFELAKCSQIK